jgi:hypothetical protein
MRKKERKKKRKGVVFYFFCHFQFGIKDLLNQPRALAYIHSSRSFHFA